MSDLQAAVAAGVLGAEEGHRALLQSTAEVARAIFKARASSIFLLDTETDELVFEAVAGEGAQPLVVDDLTADTRFSQEAAESTGYVPKALMAVPLLVEDRALGVLEVLDRSSEQPFSLADMNLLGLFASQAAV